MLKDYFCYQTISCCQSAGLPLLLFVSMYYIITSSFIEVIDMANEKEKAWHTDFAQKITQNPGKKQVSREQITGKVSGNAKSKEEK